MKVGVVGLGNMGNPMAANLVRGGHDVVVHDLNPTAIVDGARRAATAADFAGCEVVVTMLPTGIDVADALLDGPDPIAEHIAGAVVVDMSSADPVGTRILGDRLAAAGVALVDAPVSGGVPRAVTGTLAIMIGGAPDDVERARPVLQLLGDRHFEVGALGCGHAMKSLNNFVAGTAFVAAAEAVRAGARFGLDPDVMMDVMNAGTARCFNTEMVIKQHVNSGAFASGFALGLLTKDVGIAAGLAEAMGVQSGLSREITDRLSEARDVLGGNVDHTRAAEFWTARERP